jgi:diaminopimelate decarboxylase
MPQVEPGEVLAIMDSGAYFTGWESSFSFPRSAIIVVDHEEHKLIRRRETFEDMVIRDEIGQGF